MAVAFVIVAPAVVAVVAWVGGDEPVAGSGAPGDDRPDGSTGPDGPRADGRGDGRRAEPDAPGDLDRAPGAAPEPGDQLEPPDVGGLDGQDALYATLLMDIDEAEGVMMGFQAQVAATFLGAQDGEQLMADLGDAAREHLEALRELRPRLEAPVEVASAETVRAAYVEHLDTWVDYMEAVEENPRVLAREGSDVGYTVTINATADAFARTLEQQVPDDLDADVRRFATEILDRGFRGSSAPTV